MGTLVVDGSTQLVTNEDTKDISESFWEKYGISYETFQNIYEIKPLAIPSSFEGHTIPGDLIYSPGSIKKHSGSCPRPWRKQIYKLSRGRIFSEKRL